MGRSSHGVALVLLWAHRTQTAPKGITILINAGVAYTVSFDDHSQADNRGGDTAGFRQPGLSSSKHEDQRLSHGELRGLFGYGR